MNTTELSPAKNAVSLYTEQPASVSVAEEKDHSNYFYLAGGIINITMISAYFIWAFRAWKKADKRKGR